MSAASRILKHDKFRLLYRLGDRRQLFSPQCRFPFSGIEAPPSMVLRRFLATPVKTPPQPGSVQKPEPETPASSSQKPPPAAQKPQTPTVSGGQKTPTTPVQKVQPAAPVQKVQTPLTPAKASLPATPAAQKIQATSSPLSGAKTATPTGQATHQTPQNAPSTPKVQPPPTSTQTSSAQGGQPPTGSPSGPKDSVASTPQAASKKKVVLASVATAGILSAIFYWQSTYSFMPEEEPQGGIEESSTDDKDKDEGGAVPLMHDEKAIESVPSENNSEKYAGSAGQEQSEDSSGAIEVKGSQETEQAAARAGEERLASSVPAEQERLTVPAKEEEHPAATEEEHPAETKEEHPAATKEEHPAATKEKNPAATEEEHLRSPVGDIGGDSKMQITSAEQHTSLSLVPQEGHEANVRKSADNKVLPKQQEPLSVSEASGGQPLTATHIDFVTAIHAAEQRQAQIDAAIFWEQLQTLHETHHRELKDIEHMATSYKEKLNRIVKDLEDEKHRHEEELRRQQQEAERTLQAQLKSRDEAAQRQVEEAQLVANADALAAITEERATFLKDLGSTRLHVEAMNIALEAKSEEAREGHTVNQLSLGTFALENALKKGAPVTDDISYILQTAGGDPLVEAAIHSLPKDIVERGTLTPAELDRQLDRSKSELKQLALIPAEGGGLLSHLLARLASSLKFSEAEASDSESVEAILCQVENHIKDGKLVEAADILERGLAGTSAQKLASQWAAQARNRAILEQVCALLRVHAAAIALSHA